MDQFTLPELHNIIVFLNRSQITGAEAIELVKLQQKLQELVTKAQAATAAPAVVAPEISS